MMIPAIIWIYVKLNPDMFLNIHLGKKKTRFKRAVAYPVNRKLENEVPFIHMTCEVNPHVKFLLKMTRKKITRTRNCEPLVI